MSFSPHFAGIVGATVHGLVSKAAVFHQGLELKQPLRNLNDLFYESQPEELPWIRTECVIDVVQAGIWAVSADRTLIMAVRLRERAGCLHIGEFVARLPPTWVRLWCSCTRRSTMMV